MSELAIPPPPPGYTLQGGDIPPPPPGYTISPAPSGAEMPPANPVAEPPAAIPRPTNLRDRLQPRVDALNAFSADPLGGAVNPIGADTLGQAATNIYRPLSAALQNTSPHLDAYGAPLGELVQSDSGPSVIDAQGKLVTVNPKQHAVLQGDDGKMMVYQRTPQSDESRASSIGRVLGFGMLAPAEAPLQIADQGPSQAQNLLKDFEGQGVNPDLASVSQSKIAGVAKTALHEGPASADVVADRTKTALEQTADAAKRAASAYGEATDEKQAGDVIQESIQRFASKPNIGDMTPEQIIAAPTRAVGLKNKAEALFDRIGSYFSPQEPVPLTNTLDALKGPMDRFATTPQLGEAITNPTLRKYFNILSPKESVTPGVPGAPFDKAGIGWEEPEAAGAASWVSSAQTRATTAAADVGYANPGWLDPGIPSVAPSGIAQSAQKIITGGSLSYPELKEFRSFIGRQLDGGGLGPDSIPLGDLKTVYGALTKDIEAAATAKGPEAAKAFSQANSYYKAAGDRTALLEKFVGSTGQASPESAYAKLMSAAQSGTKGDINRLYAARRAIPDADWGDIAAATIRTMGRPASAQADPLSGPGFSVGSFLTNYSKLSDAGKDVIFNASGMGKLKDNLDQLVRVVNAQKNVEKLANVSGTARVAGMSAAAAAFMHSPVLTSLGLAGSNIAARAIMNPTFVRWLYSGPKTPAMSPWAAHLGQLDQLAASDKTLAPIVDYLHQSLAPAYAAPSDNGRPTKSNIAPPIR